MTAPPLPPTPAGTAELFGERWGDVRRYAEFLVGRGVVAGVLGPAEVERIWTRHIRNSLAVSPFIPLGQSVVDLGSGAGLPGIPLALARPDLTVFLLEPQGRRVAFLRDALAVCGVTSPVVHSRAEHADLAADTVVARAVAPLLRLLPLSHSLLVPGGRLVALKGIAVFDEVEQVNQSLRERPDQPWHPRSVVGKAVSWPDDTHVALAAW